jgi:hypothetical protein
LANFGVCMQFFVARFAFSRASCLDTLISKFHNFHNRQQSITQAIHQCSSSNSTKQDEQPFATSQSTPHGRVKGSPRMAAAVRLVFQHPTLTQVQVLRLADCSKGEASSKNKQKLFSKRPRGVKTDDDKENNCLGVNGFCARQRL